jgi:hypothetical protein
VPLHALTPRARQTFEPVTMGHIRSHGCRELLVYCASPWCNHSATLDAELLPDETVVLDLDPRMVCTVCGLIGADVRPDWPPHTGGDGWRAQSVMTGLEHRDPIALAGFAAGPIMLASNAPLRAPDSAD